MYFECIEEFDIEKLDDAGFWIPNEYFTVEENSIWITDDINTDSVVLYGIGKNAFDYLDIPKDLLDIYFTKIEAVE